MWYSLSCLDERCSVNVFLCLIKHEKKDKVKLGNNKREENVALKGIWVSSVSHAYLSYVFLQFARCCFHSCSPGFVAVNQVVLQEPEAAWCVILWAVLLQGTTVADRGQGLGTAQRQPPKTYVIITGCLACNLCLEGSDRLFQCTRVLFSTWTWAFQGDPQELLQWGDLGWA